MKLATLLQRLTTILNPFPMGITGARMTKDHECATCDAKVPAAHMVCQECHADGCRVAYVSGIGGTKAVEATWPAGWIKASGT